MNIDPAAVLAVISEQAQRIAALEHENRALRATIDAAQLEGQPEPAETTS